MNKYTAKYISFAEARMKAQGDEVRQWAKSSNPLLSQVCREILDASEQAQK